jgi:putative tryptophan/tyrosine transport system substrate-binding protein
MKRRDFIALLGSAAAWPHPARAQQAVPVVGFLSSGSPGIFVDLVSAFRAGLDDGGFTEGKTVTVDYRWADGFNDRLTALARELVGSQVSVIAAAGPAAALAAKAASTTIPVVFASGQDPVKMGLVASYNRPGGNASGVAALIEVLGAKRLGLLRELVPPGRPIAVLLNPTEPGYESQLNDVQDGARAVGQQIHILAASSETEIDDAFARTAELGAGGIVVGVSFFYTIRREQIVAQAARRRLPAIYGQHEFMPAGGLISYATDLTDAYRQAGVYTGLVLKGVKPADLPVMQMTKFKLSINLKVARELGVTVPSGILAIADEVIE